MIFEARHRARRTEKRKGNLEGRDRPGRRRSGCRNGAASATTQREGVSRSARMMIVSCCWIFSYFVAWFELEY